MIDPRFANAGAVPLVPGYGAQQIPAQYHHHHHRHHRHHKNKARNDASPVSLDESIHKVDHSQPQYFQNDGVAQGGGYGVPYGAGGFDASAAYGATAFYPQQQYGGANFGYANQYQGGAYGQAPFVGGPGAPVTKHHRRHHRHHRHQTTEVTNVGADPAQAVPEQLIGQRSSSVLDNEQQQQQQQQQQAQVSSSGQAEASSEPTSHQKHHRRHHRHHHHHSSENAGFEQAQQTQQTQQSSSSYHHQATTAGSNGYGHINDDLIFIERGDHSPHRQEPPAGYEYKGKIEVQSIDRERTVQTQGQSVTTGQPNFCPPGSYPAVLTPGAAGPCPPGAAPYTGYLGAGAGSFGAGSFGAGAGSFGAGGYATNAGSYATSAGSYGAAQTGISGFGLGGALPPNCQVVADYVFGSGSGISTSGGQQQKVDTNVSTRATVIEVWQKRGKSETRERSRSRSRQRSPTGGPSFDFDRFRNEILAAIERMGGRGGPSTGTQTQIHPDRPHTDNDKRVESGEVRVIVQPIQPVFYMPRQTGTTTTTQPQIGPAPVGPQPAAGGAAQIVYVPRNVYVPVIKPVFVPRERVIVRPQVIHVARPVLVDRPVPVTQRPIIIDRERPIPVPVRSGGQAAQAGGSKVVREEYVYRDNLPVAYGGRCAEFAGGVNYGYMPSQQEHQYANSSTHETASIYQTQGPAVNISVPNQFQQSTSSSHVEVQQGGAGSFHGSYSNLADVGGQLNQEVVTQQTYQEGVQVQCIPVGGSAGIEGVGIVGGGPPQVEILDTAVNPFWQKTDQTTLLRRYGRPAYQIVHQSKEVEQQMYNEIRQRTSSGGVVRSASGASFGSSSGIGTVSGGGFAQY